jgi:heptosyltransferase-2
VRVVVRVPNWIGDVVLSLPALRDVRRNFQDAEIAVLARPWVADLYKAVPEVDRVVPAGTFRENVAALQGSADHAILFANSFRSALEAFRAGVRERWGYRTEARQLLLTRSTAVPSVLRGQSQVYYYRAMLAGLGLRVSAVPDSSLRCPDAWAERGARLLGEEGPWLGLNPGAAFGTAKRWIPERYAAVADRLAESHGLRTVVIGGPGEAALGASIASAMSRKPRLLVGETSLEDLVGVLSRLTLLVTNDSGPMHLAGALGVPEVAIFGPTDDRETAPRGRHAIVRESVPCAPCGLRDCPIDHRCMTRVSVERVAAECRALLPGPVAS